MKETAKVNGTNLHRLGTKVEIIAGRLDTKSEATRVQNEFDTLRYPIAVKPFYLLWYTKQWHAF